ncbi:hypothetical protein [Photobacterium phosphoreum]|uniref:hypothetical protein n=1 Tax=Photobacterium phosphoreum TaxID=659 RepID=UPI001E50CC60|nr:hypothetical protein [Photobacterium phosphoreum]MCD9477041.1 hypothetical protein [Photobacterium phosphoreum]MCD9508557.1 hypothetical protein [Photobacterium phosphoreum]MCF2177809.1 hypothetical protein [Photobacterium phosphoreum]
MLLINSPSSLSIFSRVIQESYNSTISHSSDVDIFINEKSIIEQLLAKIFNYNNLSVLHHALKTGATIGSQDIKTITFERFNEVLGNNVVKLNDVGMPCNELLSAEILFMSMRSAIGRFEEPTSVQFSVVFQEENPEVLTSYIVWLCLDDLVIYADSEHDYILNCVRLDVSKGLFTHNFIESFSDAYLIHLLVEIRASMHFVGFTDRTSFIENSYALNSTIHIALAQNERVNKFNYYLKLFQLYFKYERSRLTSLHIYDLGLENLLYLFQITDEPINYLLTDLPYHLTLDEIDEELFLRSLTHDFLMLLGDYRLHIKAEDTSSNFIPKVILPIYLKSIITEERINKSYCVNYIISLQDADGYIIERNEEGPIKVYFLQPKYRIWLNYHQLYGHKADRFLEKEFSCFKQGLKYALEFLAQNEHLSPDFERMTTSEFCLNIVNVAEYLDGSRDIFNTVSIKGKCDISKWQTKIELLGQNNNISFISGSGLATTLLRMPLLFTNQTYFYTSVDY